MTIYIASVNAEGHVNNIWVTGVIPDMAEGPDPSNSAHTIVHITGTIEDQVDWIATHYYKAGVWETREERPNEYHYWENEAWVLDSVTLHKMIREVRTQKLFLSDWTQFADSPLTDEQKAKWATYRLFLRHIPATHANATSYAEVDWPTEP
tara:strand:- start:41 stop:493 length:453 start_codon:yes stop_codon:yes gene_type:complete